MTIKDFEIFKNGILSKSTGANIHKLVNMLGAMRMLLEEEFEPEKDPKVKELLQECHLEIKRIIMTN